MSAICFLIAEPNQAVQTFVRQQLEAHGFDSAHIHTASTPRAAAQLAAEVVPDFLLTDTFDKEGMSGLGLYQAVAKLNPECSFALLGNAASSIDDFEAASAGADFLLAKPFTAAQFRETLTQALHRLAEKHPHISLQMQQAAMPTAPATPTAPSKILLPQMQQHKAGDQVSYLNRRETVKEVIFRRGEMVVQLHGIPGMVEASKLQRL